MAYTLELSPRPKFVAAEGCSFSPLPAVRALSNMIEPSQEAVVLAHLPQVRLVARSLWERARFAVELDDLIGYGMLGLLDAVRKFDSSRGVLLKTYAEHRIRGAILDGLRGMDWLSRSARRHAKSQPKDQATEKQQAGPLEVCFTGKEDRTIAEREPVRTSPPKLTSLFCGGGVGEIERLYQNSRPPADWSQHQPTPERLLERKQERAALTRAIEELPERQRQVLDLYYRQELSMKQIAVVMGVHESRVSQIHLAAITRLRKTLNPQASKSTVKMPLPPKPPRLTCAVGAVAMAG